MLKVFILHLFMLLVFTGQRSATIPAEEECNMYEALKQGDALKLSNYFGNMVDISLDDKMQAFSRSQAGMILKDFFLQNEVKDFTILHSDNKDDGSYSVGYLRTENSTYQTILFVRKKMGKEYLEEIRLQETKEPDFSPEL